MCTVNNWQKYVKNTKPPWPSRQQFVQPQPVTYVTSTIYSHAETTQMTNTLPSTLAFSAAIRSASAYYTCNASISLACICTTNTQVNILDLRLPTAAIEWWHRFAAHERMGILTYVSVRSVSQTLAFSAAMRSASACYRCYINNLFAIANNTHDTLLTTLAFSAAIRSASAYYTCHASISLACICTTRK